MKRVVVTALAAVVLCSPALSASAAGTSPGATTGVATGQPAAAASPPEFAAARAKAKRYFVTVNAIGDEARIVGSDTSCTSKAFKAGQRIKIVGKKGKTLSKGALGECELRMGGSIPGIGAVASPALRTRGPSCMVFFLT